MVAGLDDDEEVHHVGREDGLLHRLAGVEHGPARGDFLRAPARRFGEGRQHQPGEGGDLGFRKLGAEARHLGGGPALGDHLGDRRGLEPSEALGDEGGSGAAQPVLAMAGGAALGEEHARLLGRCRRSRQEEKKKARNEPLHGVLPGMASPRGGGARLQARSRYRRGSRPDPPPTDCR